ncbi:MAG: glycine cleavage system protein H [Desulfobacteraceae bacterium]|nr:glycine cleavage system protein H [Desulfobacteraceae bacterium]
MNTTLKLRTAPDCLWKQAGVVKEKNCFKDFFCNGCRFDRAMNRVCIANEEIKRQGLPLKGKSAGFEFWKDRLQKKSLAKRPCIHHMKGHIEYKNCPKAYHCIDCEFDQYFHDQFKVNAVLKPVGFDDVNGVSLPMGYYLHSGHAWIKIEDQGMVRIGIDDFASRLLGKFDTFSSPLMGERLEQGKPAFTLSRDGHDVSFLSPVSGVITEINTQVRQSPGMINQSPYTDGWVFILYCPNLKQELKQLMFMDTCKGFMGKEVKHLYDFLEQETQLKAADGGALVSDLYGNLPGISWESLLKEFIPQEQEP